MTTEELKESYLLELNKIKEKIYLYRDCEARNRLIRDYNSYVTYLKEIGLIKKEELPEYYEFMDLKKYNFRNWSRFVLNKQKLYKSHKELYGLAQELIQTVNSCNYYEEEMKKINQEEGFKLMEEFFKWVSDDCYEFYCKMRDAKHIAFTNQPTLSSYSLPCNYTTLPFVVIGKGKTGTNLYVFDVYAHEFGHAYCEYLTRNNSFPMKDSQYLEFFSILFEKMFLQFLEEKHLYLDEIEKIRRYDLHMRADELSRIVVYEELIEKGYIKDRLGFEFYPNIDKKDIIEMITNGHILDKDEYFKLKKAKKEEKKKELLEKKKLDPEQVRLIRLLYKAFKDVNFEDFNYDTDEKEKIVKLRLKSLVEELKEGHYQNVCDILISLCSMKKNKSQFRELIQEYTSYHYEVNYLNTMLSHMLDREVKLSQDDIYKTTIINYIITVFNKYGTIPETLEALFGDYLTKEQLDESLNKIMEVLNNVEDDDVLDVFINICHDVFANMFNKDESLFEGLVDKFYSVVYDKRAKVEKREVMKKYVDNLYVTNESSYAPFIANMVDALIDENYIQAKTILNKFLEQMKVEKEDREEILSYVEKINTKAVNNEKIDERIQILDALKTLYEHDYPDYDLHTYMLGRVFASYFASQIKNNHTEGLKNAIEFIQLGDTYSYSEVLKM